MHDASPAAQGARSSTGPRAWTVRGAPGSAPRAGQVHGWRARLCAYHAASPGGRRPSRALAPRPAAARPGRRRETRGGHPV